MRASLFLATGVAITGCAPPERAEQLATEMGAILGGSVDSEHRAVMALTHSLAEGRYGLCTASVFHVDDRSALLVTAAHCVVALDEHGDVATPPVPLPAHELRASAGRAVDADRLLEREYRVTSVSVAPGYNGFLGNPDDVAIVQIVGVGSDFPQLPLVKSSDAPPTMAEAVTLVGFGQTEDADDTGVRRVTTQSISWQDAQFIGFDQSGGQGLCEGDSGGPVLLQRNGHEVIAAVNSLAKGSEGQACVANGTSVRLDRQAALIEKAIAEMPTSLDCNECKLSARAPGSTCSEPSACDGDCAALVSCADACNDRICIAGCALNHADGLEQHRAALSGAGRCAEQACAEPCRAAPRSEPKSDGCSYTPRGRDDEPWLAALGMAVLGAACWRAGARRR